MTNTELVLAIVGAVIGSGGISAIVSTLISAKKFKADARKIETDADSIKVQTEISEMDFINKRLQEIAKASQEEAEATRKQNEKMEEKVNNLNEAIQGLIYWIINDNQKYRNWLETELRLAKPEIVLPECAPPPQVYNRQPPTAPPVSNT